MTRREKRDALLEKGVARALICLVAVHISSRDKVQLCVHSADPRVPGSWFRQSSSFGKNHWWYFL